MKKSSTSLSALNIILLCACLVTLVTTEAIVSVKARSTCNPPPLFPPNVFAGTYWLPNKSIKVEIDDAWNETDRNALADGARKWNLVSIPDCSFVTFTDFSQRHFTDYSSDPLLTRSGFKKPIQEQTSTEGSFIIREGFLSASFLREIKSNHR